MAITTDCPVCNRTLQEQPTGDETVTYRCVHCGRFRITPTAEETLRHRLDVSKAGRFGVAAFSYVLRRMQQGNAVPLINSANVQHILDTATLPTPDEQANNFIRWFGTEYPEPGARWRVSHEQAGAIIGVYSEDNFLFVVEGLLKEGLLEGGEMTGGAAVELTFRGWRHFESLQRGAPSGRNAFMAMQYGDAGLDRIFTDHFRPAVKQTCFDLKRLDDEPRAGLLDAHMMLNIKTAWFLIADLTHSNRGAYWEAGYAAGLGKPVIYTCEQTIWSKEKTHFDTNHHLHIPWDAADIGRAVQRLKDTIRLTIPEAKQQDSD